MRRRSWSWSCCSSSRSTRRMVPSGSTDSWCGRRTSRRKTYWISMFPRRWSTPCGRRDRSWKTADSCGAARRSTRRLRTRPATVLQGRGRVSRRCRPSSGLAAQPWRRGPKMSRRCRGDLRQTATVRAAVEALREAVDGADAECRKHVAAAAWHAEPVLRFLCARFG